MMLQRMGATKSTIARILGLARVAGGLGEWGSAWEGKWVLAGKGGLFLI